MATNHTENYQLNLWEPGDKFVRTEFNENFTKLDAAIAAAALGNCRVEYGTYVGRGSTSTVTLRLGYQPKLLFVASELNAYVLLFVWPARAPLGLAYGNGILLDGEWLEDGVQWKLANSYNEIPASNFNAKDTTYHYIAIR